MPTKKQQDLVADIIERETYRADKTSSSFENQIRFQKNLAPLQAGALLPDLFSSIMTSNGGPARENRFAVKIITPRKLQKEGYISKGFDFETLSLLCDECELPETMVNVISYKDASQSRKTVSGYKNKDISFSFVLTQNYFIKKLFEIWRSFIFDKKTYRANYKDDYTTDIFIAQLDSSNRPIYGVFLKRAFPVKIDDINLTSKNKNTQVNLEVKLAYDDFEEILIGEPSSGIDPSIFTMKNFDNILSSGQEDTSLSDIIYNNFKSHEINLDFFQDKLFTQSSRLGEKITRPFDKLTDALNKVPLVGDILPDVLGIDALRSGVTNSINDTFFSITNPIFDEGNSIVNSAKNAVFDEIGSIGKSAIKEVSIVKDDLFSIGSKNVNYAKKSIMDLF